MEEENKGKISAKVYSLKSGYYEADELKLIRIKSKEYNLVIMEDYLPVIGEVEGSVTFVKDEFEKELSEISGFYRCAHNEFELIIRGEKQ